ncbi:MAG: tryptophan-rich sensory protein [Inconstantimicrobium porci]|nr:TspO/MBR family protein [Inconstantimicrobium porci]MDD6770557.1 tryptophan-rich sensory protein [Inconstantimicrobium porci]
MSRNGMETFQTVKKPVMSPTAKAFPIVWTILFTLLGISLYLIWNSEGENKQKALIIFALQLVFNFIWSPVFFIFKSYLAAFIILMILLVLIVMMISEFKKLNKTAEYLNIPYLLWVTFAGYLNFSIYLLNK